MSWLSKITGRDAARNKKAAQSAAEWGQGNDPNDQVRKALLSEEQGGGWQQAFQQTAQSTINQALPQLRNSLQLSREDAIRRGISTGDLATSNEGDITAAWGQNISNTLGGLATSEYENNQNRYLSLLTGSIDRTQSQQNQNSNNWFGLGGAALSTALLAL